METIEAISLILGVAWASGINLYAAVLVLGYMGSTGHVNLPPDLEILSSPVVMAAAGLMYVIEFFADKVPGVDTGWDVLHTFVRIPAGAMLAMGMAEGLEMNEAVQFAALLLGGGIAATSHAAKAGSRVLINTSPEPFSNWTASITEDVVVIGGLWASLQHPVLFVVALVLFLVLVVWLLPKIWRALKRIVRAIGRFFSGRNEDSTEQSGSTRKEIMDAIYEEDQGQPKQTQP
jgi:Sec-independent protein translocase protein TatA